MPYMIIDGNSIGHAALHTKELICDGMQTQAIFGSLNTIRALKLNNLNHTVLVLWDGYPQFRYDMFPDYKGNRDYSVDGVDARQTYGIQRTILQMMLTHLGVTQARAPDFEADDLAGFYTRRTMLDSKEVLLITGDKDWQQLVEKGVTWHDPRNYPGKYCNSETFFNVTGYRNVEAFLQGKALVGDTSDNIPGAGGIGETIAPRIMNHFHSMHGLINEWGRFNGCFKKGDLPDDLDRSRNKINSFLVNEDGKYRNWQRNMKLMDLRTAIRDTDIQGNIEITRGKKDFTKFTDMCGELAFITIRRNIKAWGIF